MTFEKILRKAEEQGLLPVESDHRGISYVFDPTSRRVLIMAARGKDRRAVILPNEAIRELADALEALCG